MRINKILFTALLSFGLTGLFCNSWAQTDIKEDQLTEHENKVKDIISFLEYVLNTLGSPTTSARDKDVIINQSYTKIFRDSDVQIEDDLDENRDVVTNKNVQAYLKDVDFFFKSVLFDFDIEDISHYVNQDGKLFFKASLTRNLRAVNIEGDSINNTQKRFIEVNLDPETQDLKIASFYTHQYSREEALSRWWNGLSYEWQSIFKRKVGLADSVTTSDIKNISQIEELDVSGHQYIRNIEPLSTLTDLKRLDISNTNIQDLNPIRNLTKLEELNLSGTQVNKLDALKYASSLKYLDLQNTPVESIEIASRLTSLESLNLNNTNVFDLAPIADLKNVRILVISGTPVNNLEAIKNLQGLEELNFTSTKISDLQPVSGFKTLEILRADSTLITSLAPLAELTSLKVLSINYTKISDLSPLSDLPELERVYCDVTVVTKADASAFMSKNPGLLVIFKSEELKTWWYELSESWKSFFKKSFRISGPLPTKEELAKITAMDSLNISGKDMNSIEPLVQLKKLKTLVARNIAVSDLQPLADLRTIEYLDVSGSQVTNFEPVASLTNLRVFKANTTSLNHLEDLMHLERLTTLELDETFVTENNVLQFLRQHPTSLIIFKTDYLQSWWAGLTPLWRNVLSDQSTLGAEPSKEQLHKLILLQSVQFAEAPVTDLKPLSEFLRLKKIRFSGTAVTDLSPVANFEELEDLQASRSPLRNISALVNFLNLKMLDISNTPVDDLDPISGLYHLKELNCSGTQIKRLKDLDNLANLKILDCSNTRVKRLDDIDHLDLKVLKCYNTRISKRKIRKFKQSHPECIVTYY